MISCILLAAGAWQGKRMRCEANANIFASRQIFRIAVEFTPFGVSS